MSAVTLEADMAEQTLWVLALVPKADRAKFVRLVHGPQQAMTRYGFQDLCGDYDLPRICILLGPGF